MSEPENAADLAPAEPDLSPPSHATEDSVPALDVDSLQILVRPPVQEGADDDVPPITAARTVAENERKSQAARESKLLFDAVQVMGEKLDRRLDALQVLFERE